MKWMGSPSLTLTVATLPRCFLGKLESKRSWRNYWTPKRFDNFLHSGIKISIDEHTNVVSHNNVTPYLHIMYVYFADIINDWCTTEPRSGRYIIRAAPGWGRRPDNNQHPNQRTKPVFHRTPRILTQLFGADKSSTREWGHRPSHGPSGWWNGIPRHGSGKFQGPRRVPGFWKGNSHLVPMYRSSWSRALGKSHN